MGECEVCGEEGGDFFVKIEGAKLWACEDCARRGQILQLPSPKPKKKGEVVKGQKEIDLVEDFGRRIRAAREKMHVGVDVLGERISESVSYLERLENEKTLPSEAVARKLERELGIVLFEVDAQEHYVKPEKKVGLTLGDLVTVKKKKKD